MVLTTGCNRWDTGTDVIVEGNAVRVTDEKVLTRVTAAFAAKWDGRWDLAVRDGRFYNRNASDWPSEVFAVTASSTWLALAASARNRQGTGRLPE